MFAALSLLSGGLSILGLAVVLASLSYADWRGWARGWPQSQRATAAGLVLFCAGLALVPGAWWEHLLWAILALCFLGLLLRDWVRRI